MLHRRSLLGAAGALLVAPASAAGEAWLTTAQLAQGYAALALDAEMSTASDAASPVRLHGIVASPSGSLAVAVGRRPGQMALAFDRDRGGILATFQPGAGRVFSGHGRFSCDARWFFTNELERPSGANAMGRGVVAVRTVEARFAIVHEWPSGGDGPHDLMHRADTLVVVANGGIEPHTSEARDAEKAGSCITLLDAVTGAVRAEGRLPTDLASLSLRHLAHNTAGKMVVAAQDLLADGVARPLLFAVGSDAALTAYDAPDDAMRQLHRYVGSVAFDCSGAFVACASPRGGRVAVWHSGGQYIGSVSLADGCGLAATRAPGRFLATSGYGEVILLAADQESVGIVARRTGGPRFDNHMIGLS
jgi:hypothetical protein